MTFNQLKQFAERYGGAWCSQDPERVAARKRLVIMNLVCAPGGKAFWKERSYMFGDEFRRYIENDVMKREPHSDAKPMGAFSIALGTE